MNDTQHKRLIVSAGAAGIAGTLCYLGAVFVSLGPFSYPVIMAWPVLSIVLLFGLYRFIAQENEGMANHLAFIMGCIGFALVATMISVQLAVRMGIEEYIMEASVDQQAALQTIRRALRLVDMGMDVAWDIFIGSALLFVGVAMKGHSRLGLVWGMPTALLGALLIILNVWTFPWPPNTRDLFDVGPFIGLFIILLSIRLLILGLRMKT